MSLIGKVLWWDARDKNGILVDELSNEFYFDLSVLKGSEKLLKPGKIVYFKKNKSIVKSNCACAVQIPPTRSQQKLLRDFDSRSELSA